MNEYFTGRRNRSGEIAKCVGSLLSVRARTLVLFLALILTGSETTALGQVACFNQCQQNLAQCLQQAQGDPIEEARCEDNYDACIEWCIIE